MKASGHKALGRGMSDALTAARRLSNANPTAPVMVVRNTDGLLRVEIAPHVRPWEEAVATFEDGRQVSGPLTQQELPF